MKRYFTYCLAIMISFLFVACSKKNTNTKPAASMTATVGGTNFISTTTGAVQGLIGGVNDLTITGNNGSDLITLDVWGYNHSAGSFPISASSSSGTSAASYNTGSTLATQKDAVYGTVTITNVSSGGTITGNFNFVASDSTHVSNGNFTVTPL